VDALRLGVPIGTIALLGFVCTGCGWSAQAAQLLLLGLGQSVDNPSAASAWPTPRPAHGPRQHHRPWMKAAASLERGTLTSFGRR
jgi:hypothetical protein